MNKTTYIDPALPAEYLAIARQINVITVTTIGGACFFHNIAAHRILKHHGIQTQIVVGGAVFRTGSGAMDAVIWADQNNQASGSFQHFWLADDAGRIIDFSTKTWRGEMDIDPAVLSGQIEPLQWEIEPPEFIWQHRKDFIGKPKGRFNLPDIGKAIYNAKATVSDKTFDAEFMIDTMVKSTLSRIKEAA